MVLNGMVCVKVYCRMALNGMAGVKMYCRMVLNGMAGGVKVYCRMVLNGMVEPSPSLSEHHTYMLALHHPGQSLSAVVIYILLEPIRQY